MNVDAVRDQLRRRVGDERRAGDARLAVVHPGHRIEQMREVPRAPLQRRRGLGIVGRRVADREEHAVAEVLDQCACAVELRCHRHHPVHPRCEREQRRQLVDVGGTDRRRILCTGAAPIDERPFEMNTDDLGAGAPLRTGDRLHRLLNVGHRSRERRRAKRGRPVFRMEAKNSRVRLLARVHEVGPVAAVHVNVDEAGRDEATRALRGLRNIGGLGDVDDRLVADRDQRVVLNRAANERPSEELPDLHRLL